ncbi:hypothetical protein JCM3765_002484 [Sporobolomyces pararoseus]
MEDSPTHQQRILDRLIELVETPPESQTIGKLCGLLDQLNSKSQWIDRPHSTKNLTALETLCSRYSTNRLCYIDLSILELLLEKGKADLIKVGKKILREIVQVDIKPDLRRREVDKKFEEKVLGELEKIEKRQKEKEEKKKKTEAFSIKETSLSPPPSYSTTHSPHPSNLSPPPSPPRGTQESKLFPRRTSLPFHPPSHLPPKPVLSPEHDSSTNKNSSSTTISTPPTLIKLYLPLPPRTTYSTISAYLSNSLGFLGSPSEFKIDSFHPSRPNNNNNNNNKFFNPSSSSSSLPYAFISISQTIWESGELRQRIEIAQEKNDWFRDSDGKIWKLRFKLANPNPDPRAHLSVSNDIITRNEISDSNGDYGEKKWSYERRKPNVIIDNNREEEKELIGKGGESRAQKFLSERYEEEEEKRMKEREDENGGGETGSRRRRRSSRERHGRNSRSRSPVRQHRSRHHRHVHRLSISPRPSRHRERQGRTRSPSPARRTRRESSISCTIERHNLSRRIPSPSQDLPGWSSTSIDTRSNSFSNHLNNSRNPPPPSFPQDRRASHNHYHCQQQQQQQQQQTRRDSEEDSEYYPPLRPSVAFPLPPPAHILNFPRNYHKLQNYYPPPPQPPLPPPPPPQPPVYPIYHQNYLLEQRGREFYERYVERQQETSGNLLRDKELDRKYQEDGRRMKAGSNGRREEYWW